MEWLKTTPKHIVPVAMKEKRMVYLVDDDDAVRDSLMFLLEAHGFHVAAFSSIGDFDRADKPDSRSCLILDHHLPGVSGLEYLSSPKTSERRMPVIFITGGADANISARARSLGVAAFLEKPVTEMALLAAIENAFTV